MFGPKIYQKISLVIYFFLLSPLYSIFLSIIFVLFPPFWGVASLYVIWYFYDKDTPKKGGRSLIRFRNHVIWRYLSQYFSTKLIKTVDLPNDKNYIFGCHPHGVLCFGTQINFGTEATKFSELFPGLEPHIVTIPLQFKFPIRRELLLAAGMITSDAESIEYVLKKQPRGQVVCIVPGGAEEVYDSHSDNYNLTLLKRKGFIRLAIQNNAELVPVFNFGENSTYKQFPNEPGSIIRNFQKFFFKKFGFPLAILSGCGVFNKYFGMMPFPVPITTVVGAPIEMEHHPDPPQDLVDKIHQRYIRALVGLFDEHKTRYGIEEDVKLRIM